MVVVKFFNQETFIQLIEFMFLLSRGRLFATGFLRVSRRLSHAESNVQKALKTPFYDFHVAEGAKLIDFFGYSLPIVYHSQSIIDSHRHVRAQCGIFDVSHMLQLKVSGADRIKFMESLTVSDLQALPRGSGTLSVYLNENGGIIDDLIIHVCREPYLYVVSNAACAGKVRKHLIDKQKEFVASGNDVNLRFLDHALLAVQGPKANEVVRNGVSPTDRSSFEDLYFMETTVISSLFGLSHPTEEIRITRCGYTGEDGYEISLPATVALPLARKLCEFDEVKPIGLAARDTLRLEGGMCLYGNDLSETTTPVEASLAWLIGKRRRKQGDSMHFPGFERIHQQLSDKTAVKQKRVGLSGPSGPQPRPGSKVVCVTASGNTDEVGQVTSGCLSPSLGHNISMAYVRSDLAVPGQKLQVVIRGKQFPYTVTGLPFVPNHYVRRPKQA
ncbi:Aminomethyltransferase [Fasciola hepatica]|uniref:Aminomethyltransferase n=1 Tax=Fasciola hepatica TaxID=6192 RepID=A0A4E0RAS7_FASHE|nr:Aminomethyltransferase [Fasciola hepatica]